MILKGNGARDVEGATEDRRLGRQELAAYVHVGKGADLSTKKGGCSHAESGARA